ncbi:hypothetical protein, partial [Escherichia coli]|uniref:hypothetical protein n=1 Tax=Escherichia coli TaxID=562 RepID=UPI0019655C85
HGMRPVVFIVDGFKSGKDASQNPLTAEQRKTIAKKAFPGAYVDVVSNAYEVIDVLQVQGYKPGVWVAGSDRVQGYKKLLKSA